MITHQSYERWSVCKITLLFVVMMHASGCYAEKKSLPGKLGWKAEAFFADANIIRLCGAIDNRDHEAVKQILDTGIDLNSKGKEGMSPLIWSMAIGDMAIYEELLKAGADPNAKYYFTAPVFVPGESVVHIASGSSRTEFLTLALKHGGNPNLQRESDGDTPLNIVVTSLRTGKETGVIDLIESGANPDGAAGLGDVRFHTALAYAVQRNEYNIAALLIKAGASTGLIHPHIPKDNNVDVLKIKRVVHIIAKQLDRAKRLKNLDISDFPKEQADALTELIALLEERGESLEQAMVDVKRWRQELLDRPR